MPIFAQTNCTTYIIGNVNNAVHSVEKPSAAPACAYVPMPDGSSSDAPVIRPGPRTRKNRLTRFCSLARRAAKDLIGRVKRGILAVRGRRFRFRDLFGALDRVVMSASFDSTAEDQSRLHYPVRPALSSIGRRLRPALTCGLEYRQDLV